ncbi:MAG TPA: winged helix-turn-helix transcriptional regulator [archaeon]|nr:winged helix-turn-helix transcriptional regulator [archaeon]
MDTLILIIGIIIVIFGIYYIIKNKKNSTKQNNNKITYDKDALTERQLKIMELLEKNDGKITQSELQKTLNYPKAALSRNLNSLEKKDIISKERKGMTMLVKIKEKNQKD